MHAWALTAASTAARVNPGGVMSAADTTRRETYSSASTGRRISTHDGAVIAEGRCRVGFGAGDHGARYEVLHRSARVALGAWTGRERTRTRGVRLKRW